MRFWENKSFREIARAVDKTEAAGQKQTERALNKLSTSLSRHGATISVAILTAGLGSTLTAATISQSALATAPTPFPPPPCSSNPSKP